MLNGRWSFSSGTDHCEWVFLGGLVVDEEGNTSPMPGMHFVLPRKDYDIIDDSWNVVGLRGSGSKDVVVRDAFVPEYRTIDGGKVIDGRAACRIRSRRAPLPYALVSDISECNHSRGHRNSGSYAGGAYRLPAEPGDSVWNCSHSRSVYPSRDR